MGVLDPDEDALLRRVAGLIYVPDQDRGAARKRVLRRLGVGGRLIPAGHTAPQIGQARIRSVRSCGVLPPTGVLRLQPV